MENKYEQQAKQLSEVIDIAIESFKNLPPKNWTVENIKNVINNYVDFKIKTLNHELQFKNLQSLKYIENDVFIFFQEGSGTTVEYFWNKLRENNSCYKRENKVLKILKREKINNQIEYNFVKDIITPYRQENLITLQEEKLLKELLEKYEKK